VQATSESDLITCIQIIELDGLLWLLSHDTTFNNLLAHWYVKIILTSLPYLYVCFLVWFFHL